LNGSKDDTTLLLRQKEELERIITEQKSEILECDRKSSDYYQQLLSTKENFSLLHNEQKLISDELTLKQSELMKSERVKLAQEAELLQLRPLKYQLENMSESAQRKV